MARMAGISGGPGRRALLRSLGACAAVVAVGACDPASLTQLGGGSNTVDVALLIPAGSTDGNVAFLAQNLNNAARLAIAGLEGVTVNLRTYDTAGNAERAGQLARQAIADGADVIVGPLFAASANAAGVAASARNVPVISFSNNPAVAGGNVFVLGPTFDNTAQRILGYARAQGKSRVVIVYGENEAERTGRDAIVRAAQSTGIAVVGTVGFEMSQEGVVNAVPSIVQQVESSGADLLFLTSNTDTALPIVTQLLPESGLPPERIQYAGLTRWDVPASALSLPGVQGGWFALPDTGAVNAFSARYTAAYGQAPHGIAGLGFDAIAAIGALAGAGQPITPQTLTQSRGFAGASGAFRFLPNGSNQRALSIATIRDKARRIIDAAPGGFGLAGF